VVKGWITRRTFVWPSAAQSGRVVPPAWRLPVETQVVAAAD
jgi:hypothetical protein